MPASSGGGVGYDTKKRGHNVTPKAYPCVATRISDLDGLSSSLGRNRLQQCVEAGACLFDTGAQLFADFLAVSQLDFRHLQLGQVQFLDLGLDVTGAPLKSQTLIPEVFFCIYLLFLPGFFSVLQLFIF